MKVVQKGNKVNLKILYYSCNTRKNLKKERKNIMIEVKRFLTKYEVTHPALEYCTTIDNAVANMEINGIKSKDFAKCFKCKHEFTNDDKLYSAYVFGLGARFFCKECADEINAEATVFERIPLALQEKEEAISVSSITADDLVFTATPA